MLSTVGLCKGHEMDLKQSLGPAAGLLHLGPLCCAPSMISEPLEPVFPRDGPELHLRHYADHVGIDSLGLEQHTESERRPVDSGLPHLA